MIKINFPLLDQAIEIEGVKIFTIEDSFIFRKIVEQLLQYDENSEIKLYDREFNGLKEDEIFIISDLLSFDFNQPSVIKSVLNDILNRINEEPEVHSKLDFHINQIEDVLSFYTVEHDLNLSSPKLDLLSILKTSGIKVSFEEDSLLDKLYDICQLFKYLVKKRLLIFVNTQAYLTQDELKMFFEFIQLNQIDCLIIERFPIKGFQQYLLDEDCYLIEQNMV